MKRIPIIVLFFVHLIFILIKPAYNQIPNGDFEHWDVSLSQNIHTWLQIGNVSAQSNSIDGPFAAKLEFDSVNFNAAFLLHGGHNGINFTGGVPYSERPDSIKGFFKCYSPYPLDAALLLVIFKKNGLYLSEDYFFIGVSPDTSQFQEKKFKINYNHPTEIPDSVIVFLTNPNPFQDSLYTGYLIADALNFTNATTPIPNGSFDNWTFFQSEMPHQWMSYNYAAITSGNFPVTRTSDCTSGNFAIRMENKLGLNDTLPGVIISSLNGGWPAEAFTLSERYTSLKGSFKYFPDNLDSMFIQVIFFKHDTVVGIAHFTSGETTSLYKTFDTPIIYWDNFFGIPDSALLYAAPYRFDKGAPRGNSVLYLDNLHFILNNQLFINEIVTSNTSTLYDGFGDAEDWIEIFNAGASPVVLNNYFISDNPNNQLKWRFPIALIEPHDFLIVFASGKDCYYPNLHTNFEMSVDGEPLILSNPLGQIINALPPKPLATDISWGRYPDGSNQLFYFATPTPKMPNTHETFLGFTNALPIFSHTPGFYTDSVFVTISTPLPNAQIKYTLDGSEPTLNSPIYTTPIYFGSRAGQPNTYSMIAETTPWWGWSYPQGEVFKTNMLRAKIFMPDSISIKTATGTYFIDDSIFTKYHLPVVSLITDSLNLFDYERGIYIRGKIFDDHIAQHPSDTTFFTPANYFMRGDSWERPVHVEYFTHDGQLEFNQNAGLRTHGGASRMFRQKALRLHSRKKYDNDYFNYPVFINHKTKITNHNINKYKNLLMRTSGNDNDQTFFRDAMVHMLVSHTKTDVMALQPAVVFLNGEYWGIHNFRERQDKYYFEQHYNVQPDSIVILEGYGHVNEGIDTDNLHYLNMLAYINTHNLSDTSHYDFIKTQMDVDNFLDYQSIQIYIRNTDWPGNNIRYWRKRTPQFMQNTSVGNDGRWRWILFDTDFSFGQQEGMQAPLHNTLEFATDSTNPNWPNPIWSTFLFRKLLENESFRNDYINRTADHINTSFKPQRVLDIIDSLQNLYQFDMHNHIYRWHSVGNVNHWLQQINILRNFAIYRPANMQQHIISRWNLQGTIQLTLDVSDVSHGHVKVSSVLLDQNTKGIIGLPYPWTGTYFKDVPIPLKAIAKPGYNFVGWEGTGITNPEVFITLNSDTAFKALFEIDTTYQGISLYINELMALNNSFITDEYGGYDDWIEIYNAGSDTVDIAGYYITDNLNQMSKYQIPSNYPETRIPPQGFLLLWADDESAQGPLHLPFKLSTSGESIGLYAPNFTVMDTLTYGYQLGNRSFGRYPDASPNFVFFEDPTPGASNIINNIYAVNLTETPFFVYPNPATDKVYFNKTTDIKVFNHMGQLVFEKENVSTLNVSPFDKGVYMIHEKNHVVIKLVVF